MAYLFLSWSKTSHSKHGQQQYHLKTTTSISTNNIYLNYKSHDRNYKNKLIRVGEIQNHTSRLDAWLISKKHN